MEYQYDRIPVISLSSASRSQGTGEKAIPGDIRRGKGNGYISLCDKEVFKCYASRFPQAVGSLAFLPHSTAILL